MSALLCGLCELVKDASNFSKDSRTSRGFHYWCRDCASARKRAAYAENREAEIARSAAWNKANPEKVAANMRAYRNRDLPAARAYTSAYRRRNRCRVQIWAHNSRLKRRAAIAGFRPITLVEWEAVKARHRQRCFYCNQRRRLTMDHFVPISKKGPHVISNIKPACKPCNSRKTNLDPEEFARRQGRLFW